MFKQTRLSRICTKLAGSNTSTISESLPFVSETLKPLPCLLVIHLSTFFLHLGLLCNLDQSLLRTIANVSTTANEELSARFEEVDDLLPVLVQAVLDVLATFRLIRGARESVAERYCAELLPALQQISVQKVAIGTVASIEEKRGSKFTAGSKLSSALLDETTEGCKTCS